MASSKVSSLVEKTILDKNDLLYVSSGGGDFKTKVSTLRGVANIKDYGGIADCKIVTDGAMTVAGNIITSATANFVAADVGKLIDMEDAGLTEVGIDGVAENNNLSGTITALISVTQVQVSFNALNTVAGKHVTYGTNNYTALNAAKNAGKCIEIPNGNFAISIAELHLVSEQSLIGYGQGVSILTVIGALRHNNLDQKGIVIDDGVTEITIADLTVRGTNWTGKETIFGIGGSAAIYWGQGLLTNIENIYFRNVEIDHYWGYGFRSNGDNDQTPGVTSSVINVKILYCNIHHNADTGININMGGGLLIQGCKLTYNRRSGFEIAGNRFQILDNYIAHNYLGSSIGGLGNPSIGQDILFSRNLVERNGNLVTGASGLEVGGNIVHVIISNNIIRENNYNGINISDGTPEFASLSRDIRIVNNQIVSNGNDLLVGSGTGIYCIISNVLIESNDIFDDNVLGYTQLKGIACLGVGNKLLRNNVHDNTSIQYEFALCVNSLLVTDNPLVAISKVEGNGYSGTVDTNGTAVAYKSGVLFDTNWVGVPIKITTVPYLISAVGAKPTGNYTIAGLIVTRVSGPNFDAAWIGKYIRLGPNLYFPIAAVGGVSTLTITNPIGNVIPASGVWTLNGSIGLTLQVTAGVQAGVAYVIPPHVIKLPNEGFITADFFVVPIFDAAQASTYQIVLTGNVTSSYLANGVDGQIFTFIIVQDGTGARTFAFPANVFGATAIGTTASKFNVQSFRKLGANWYAIAAGVINQG